MVVYADLILFLNSYIDFLLLWLTASIRKQSVSKFRLIIAAFIGGIYSALHLWPEMNDAYFFPMKILVSMLMIWIGFGFHSPIAYLRNLGVFYLVCFVAGGALIALHYVITGDSQVAGGIFFTHSSQGLGTPVSWTLILLGFPLVWLYSRSAFRSLEERNEIHQYLAQVRLTFFNQTVDCMGLIDTGNQLRDPISRMPVMLVELKNMKEYIPSELSEWLNSPESKDMWTCIPDDWLTRIKMVPYRGVGSEGKMMLAFKPDRVDILYQNKWNTVTKVLIGIDVGHLSMDGSYQAILHPSCLTAVTV